MKTQLLKTMRWKQVIAFYYAKSRKTGKLNPKRAECWCSTCGHTFAGEILPGDTPSAYPKLRAGGQVSGPGIWIECPKCGCTAPATYKKRLTRHPIITKKYPWTVKRAGRSIIFTCWETELKTGWKKYDLYHVPRNAYIITPEGKMLRATTGERCGWSAASPMAYSYEWRMLPKCEIADDGMGWLMGRRPGMFEGTALENAKLETILTAGITMELLAYIRLYLKHPNIENLVMTCPEIARALLLRYEYATHPGGKLANVAWVNWKAARPHEMLRMEKDTMKALEAAGGIEINKALTMQEAAASGVRIGNPAKVRQYMETLDEGWVLENLIRQGRAKETGQTLEKIMERITQYIANAKGRQAVRVKYDVLDYWRDAKRAGFDITNATVALPKDLYAAQARATDAIEYEENQKAQARFDAVTKKPCGIASADILKPIAAGAASFSSGTKTARRNPSTRCSWIRRPGGLYKTGAI